MKLCNTIDGLLHLPKKFNRIGTMSIYDLLKKTGYLEMKSQISVESIRESLTHNPECVEEWLIYSADKRSKSGWYFKQTSSNKYIVGYLSRAAVCCSQEEYSNRLDACAHFIKQEIDDISC